MTHPPTEINPVPFQIYFTTGYMTVQIHAICTDRGEKGGDFSLAPDHSVFQFLAVKEI